MRRVGRRLHQLRRLGGYTMSSLVARTGLPRSYLYKLEGGEVPTPGIQALDAVARAFDLTLADLIEYGTPKSRSHRAASAAERRHSNPKLPAGLARFIAAWEREHPGRRMPADAVRSLAAIQFRGKRPKRPKDWRAIHDTIARCLRVYVGSVPD